MLRFWVISRFFCEWRRGSIRGIHGRGFCTCCENQYQRVVWFVSDISQVVQCTHTAVYNILCTHNAIFIIFQAFLRILWARTLWAGMVSSLQVQGVSSLSTVPRVESSILLRVSIIIIHRLWGAEETTRISLILEWREYKTPIFQHLFVFILI